jgi:hypothetical protein
MRKRKLKRTIFLEWHWNNGVKKKDVKKNKKWIDLRKFELMFKRKKRNKDMEVCEKNEIKLLWKDYVEREEVMFIIDNEEWFIVIISIIK